MGSIQKEIKQIQRRISCGDTADTPFLFHFEIREVKRMNTGLIAIIIILVVIVGAIVTRRCMEFLIGGVPSWPRWCSTAGIS